jgi:hypothetical protein
VCLGSTSGIGNIEVTSAGKAARTKVGKGAVSCP